ncbi:MAG: hypothetical protein JRG91_14115 [Deltaproteobacteria bacterium]|nr:hypothetical protein [Deltaproteobacteria bacterium]
MRRTIESPLGHLRLFPVMAHMPPAGCAQDPGTGSADTGSALRESSPVIEIVGAGEGSGAAEDTVAA